MCGGNIGVDIYRALNQRLGSGMMTFLMFDDSKQMQRVEVQRCVSQNLPIQAFRLGEPALLMAP